MSNISRCVLIFLLTACIGNQELSAVAGASEDAQGAPAKANLNAGVSSQLYQVRLTDNGMQYFVDQALGKVFLPGAGAASEYVEVFSDISQSGRIWYRDRNGNDIAIPPGYIVSAQSAQQVPVAVVPATAEQSAASSQNQSQNQPAPRSPLAVPVPYPSSLLNPYINPYQAPYQAPYQTTPAVGTVHINPPPSTYAPAPAPASVPAPAPAPAAVPSTASPVYTASPASQTNSQIIPSSSTHAITFENQSSRPAANPEIKSSTGNSQALSSEIKSRTGNSQAHSSEINSGLAEKNSRRLGGKDFRSGNAKRAGNNTGSFRGRGESVFSSVNSSTRAVNNMSGQRARRAGFR
jgi:hypothetical protein